MHPRLGIPLAVAAAGALAAGGRWLWRNQGKVASSRPFNEWAFTHADRILPSHTVEATGREPWPRNDIDLADFRYTYEGREYSLDDFHRRTHSTAIVVMHRGHQVHEAYPGWFATPQTRFQLYSLTKSVTALLVGIAQDAGLMPPLDTRVAEVLPELAGLAYGNASIEDLLQMASGVGDEEVWDDPDSLINRFEFAVTTGKSMLELLRAEPAIAAPGERFKYSTVDTQVLGMVLERMTGEPIASFCTSRLWQPLGAETDAFYFLTREKPRIAIGGGSFNATVRDLARVGELVRHRGLVNGMQVVPSAWIDRFFTPVYPGHAPGELNTDVVDNYGYSTQWWIVGDRPGVITGLGVHGQYLWVDPTTETVIARTAAWNEPEKAAFRDEGNAAFLALGAWLAER